jgi:hypothetical protein
MIRGQLLSCTLTNTMRQMVLESFLNQSHNVVKDEKENKEKDQRGSIDHLHLLLQS